MKQYQVLLTESAVKNLGHIHDFYLMTVSEPVASELSDKLELALLQSAQLPERGKVIPQISQQSGRQYLQILPEPFRLIFRIEQQTEYVILLLHQRQSIQKALQNRLLQ